MDVKIGFKMTFAASMPTPMHLLLYVHPEIASDLTHPEEINILSDSGIAVPIEDYVDFFGNKSARILAPAGRFTITYDNIISRSDDTEAVALNAIQHNVEELPVEALPFLLPSRYCEVDRFGDLAWKLFGNTNPGWERVQAICDWVFENIKFGYPHTYPTKTAWDTYTEQNGVCRDFMHLAITLSRSMNIPARYATGYLGEIDVPASGSPMDFSAYMEVYLGGTWHTFDPRNHIRRVGRALMARGRDAADAALTTSFNDVLLKEFEVVTHRL